MRPSRLVPTLSRTVAPVALRLARAASSGATNSRRSSATPGNPENSPLHAAPVCRSATDTTLLRTQKLATTEMPFFFRGQSPTLRMESRLQAVRPAKAGTPYNFPRRPCFKDCSRATPECDRTERLHRHPNQRFGDPIRRPSFRSALATPNQ